MPLQELSSEIADFDYGYSDEQTLIFKMQHLLTNLNQNASQMWLLPYILFLIIGHKISQLLLLEQLYTFLRKDQIIKTLQVFMFFPKII